MNQLSPLISIIVPVYNVANFIERCVHSICAQSYQNIEILLIDDGSTDNSPAICDYFSTTDSRIKTFHKPNGGLSSARNYGIQRCTGDWLIFVDSDDFIAPDMVQKLYDAAQYWDANIAFCTLAGFTEDADGYKEFRIWGAPTTGVAEGEQILRKSAESNNGLLGGHHVIACNKLFKKNIFEHIRFPEGQLHEDEAIAHRILAVCGKIACIDDVLYYYRQRSDSIMHNTVNPLRQLSITLAYGDRLLLYCEMGYGSLISNLFSNYWAVLISQYHTFKKDSRCSSLKKKTISQMRMVNNLCRNHIGISAVRKLSISAFCRFPSMVNSIYTCLRILRSLKSRTKT